MESLKPFPLFFC